MESQIKCRFAEASDRDAVVQIIPNMHDGADTLPIKYLDCINDPSRLMFVAELERNIVRAEHGCHGLLHYILYCIFSDLL